MLTRLYKAKEIEGSYVVLEGDWGGQIYLCCPVSHIKCSQEQLKRLLDDLDAIAWKCNEEEGKGMYFEIRKPGEGIGGGMGGGLIKEDL